MMRKLAQAAQHPGTDIGHRPPDPEEGDGLDHPAWDPVASRHNHHVPRPGGSTTGTDHQSIGELEIRARSCGSRGPIVGHGRHLTRIAGIPPEDSRLVRVAVRAVNLQSSCDRTASGHPQSTSVQASGNHTAQPKPTLRRALPVRSVRVKSGFHASTQRGALTSLRTVGSNHGHQGDRRRKGRHDAGLGRREPRRPGHGVARLPVPCRSGQDT